MKYVAVAMAVLAVGCATPTPVSHIISAPFDTVQAKSLVQPGNNILKGSAFLRQRGGGVVTCAGAEVTLIPATAYATERIYAIYGNTEKGVGRASTTFTPNIQEYRTLTLRSICDAQGNFSFVNVATGTFYVTTIVRWEAGGATQGGPLMQKVELQGGQTVQVVLAGS